MSSSSNTDRAILKNIKEDKSLSPSPNKYKNAYKKSSPYQKSPNTNQKSPNHKTPIFPIN